MYLFSKETQAFYPVAKLQLYVDAGTLPNDVIEVSGEIRNTYNALPPAGMNLGTDVSGMPAWVEKSQAEHIANADFIRTVKIDQTNAFINSRQWPGKAALDRLEGDELEQYGIWLDYLDALEVVNTSSAPEITWPTQPEV